ncbi:MAG: hypothetical protein ACI9UQ_002317 [Candidatus Krumholzibacteriia bacterium]|jgi:hypothetical protein
MNQIRTALPVAYDGQPGCALVTSGTSADAGAVLALSGLGSTSGEAIQRIRLSGYGWGELNKAECHQVLRHCRHVLVPRGQLSLPVGRHNDKFARTAVPWLKSHWLTVPIPTTKIYH